MPIMPEPGIIEGAPGIGIPGMVMGIAGRSIVIIDFIRAISSNSRVWYPVDAPMTLQR
jgi:hypothetical protein